MRLGTEIRCTADAIKAPNNSPNIREKKISVNGDNPIGFCGVTALLPKVIVLFTDSSRLIELIQSS